MLNKRYIFRNDLRNIGFIDLKFTRDRKLKRVYLSAKNTVEIGKSKYEVIFSVECDEARNSKIDMVTLCRLMYENFLNFKTLKLAEQRKYAEENGEKVDY